MCYDEACHLTDRILQAPPIFTCGLCNINTRKQTQCEGRSGLSEHLEVSFEMEDHRGERMTTKLPNILVPHFESLIFAERTCSIDLIEHPKVVDRGRYFGKMKKTSKQWRYIQNQRWMSMLTRETSGSPVNLSQGRNSVRDLHILDLTRGA